MAMWLEDPIFEFLAENLFILLLLEGIIVIVLWAIIKAGEKGWFNRWRCG